MRKYSRSENFWYSGFLSSFVNLSFAFLIWHLNWLQIRILLFSWGVFFLLAEITEKSDG